jgi:hypothetical protein
MLKLHGCMSKGVTLKLTLTELEPPHEPSSNAVVPPNKNTQSDEVNVKKECALMLMSTNHLYPCTHRPHCMLSS